MLWATLCSLCLDTFGLAHLPRDQGLICHDFYGFLPFPISCIEDLNSINYVVKLQWYKMWTLNEVLRSPSKGYYYPL